MLLLVRHGETAWNAERRWQGHHDAPLNDTGRARPRPWHCASPRTSPARSTPPICPRARETAEEIARETGLEPVFDPRWREVDVGEWLGLDARRGARRAIPTATRAGSPAARAGETASRTRRWPSADWQPPASWREHAGDRSPIVCVTHGGVIRALVMHVLGMPPSARRLLATGPTATVTAIDATASDLAPALLQRRRPPARA